MSKRAVIYCRVSTDVQRDNYSIPTQVAYCQQYAKSRGYAVVGDRFVDQETGYDVAATAASAVPAYVDDYTSRDLSRPALDSALGFLETVGFDVLIVYCLDRLARDPYIRQTLEREVNKLGATVEYATGNYEDNAEGEVRKDLDATFAKWENAKRVERCSRGRKRKAETGLFVCGRAPFGYRIDKKALGGLAVVEEQAQIVRRIFEMFCVERLSLHGIVDVLTDDSSVTTQSGNGHWAMSTVRNILRNTAYVGHVFFNKSKRQSSGKRQASREREEWIKIEITPIIDVRTWQEAQRLLKESAARRRGEPKRFYLLSSMVVCAECARPYGTGTAKAGRNKRANDAPHYRHRIKSGHCENRMVSARILEPLVWDELTKLLLDPENLRNGYEESIKQQEATLARKRQHLETLYRTVHRLELQDQNLVKAYIDPDIALSKSEYLAQKSRIQADLKTVVEEVRLLEEELTQGPTVPLDLEALDTFFGEIRGMLAETTDLAPALRRRVLEMLQVQVHLHKDGQVTIEGWFLPISTRLSNTSY